MKAIVGNVKYHPDLATLVTSRVSKSIPTARSQVQALHMYNIASEIRRILHCNPPCVLLYWRVGKQHGPGRCLPFSVVLTHSVNHPFLYFYFPESLLKRNDL